MNESSVMFDLTWVKPPDDFGPFHYRLEFEAEQPSPHPDPRTASDTRIIDNNGQELFPFVGALPYADYNITLIPVNTKHNRDGPPMNIAGRTTAIGTFQSLFTSSDCL